MNPDDLILQAFINNPIQGEGLFILEGHPAKNEFRILPADQAFKDNLNCFVWNVNTGFQYMGIFTEERLAQEHIDNIRVRLRNEEGERLI